MQLVGVGIFVTGLIISRFMTEGAYKHLDTLQKGQLMEQLSGLRKYSLLAFLPVLLFLFLGASALAAHGAAVRIAAWLVFLAWVVALEVIVIRKMQAMGLSNRFLVAYARARAVLHAGLVTLIATSL